VESKETMAAEAKADAAFVERVYRMEEEHGRLMQDMERQVRPSPKLLKKKP